MTAWLRSGLEDVRRGPRRPGQRQHQPAVAVPALRCAVAARRWCGGSGPTRARPRRRSCARWRGATSTPRSSRPGRTSRTADYRSRGDRWHRSDEELAAWKEGRTGYPIVDAGMRQLLREGWMHNRARLIVAHFLCKTLYIDWREGAQHFVDLLLDADVANNTMNWQWVAGTGTDSRFNRTYNVVLQARRHDPRGDYVRRYVEELAGAGRRLPARALAAPGGRAGQAGLPRPDRRPARSPRPDEEGPRGPARRPCVRRLSRHDWSRGAFVCALGGGGDVAGHAAEDDAVERRDRPPVGVPEQPARVEERPLHVRRARPAARLGPDAAARARPAPAAASRRAAAAARPGRAPRPARSRSSRRRRPGPGPAGRAAARPRRRTGRAGRGPARPAGRSTSRRSPPMPSTTRHSASGEAVDRPARGSS